MIQYPSGQHCYQQNSDDELGDHWVFHYLLNNSQCDGGSKNGGDGIILDMGANEGAFALLSASYGCRVITIEPQDSCLKDLFPALIFNPTKYIPIVYQAFISSAVFQTMTGGIDDGCGGSFSYVAEDIIKKTPKKDNTPNRHLLRSLSIDELMINQYPDDDILLWHIDVEGAEIEVLLSGMILFSNRLIHNLIVEMIPERWGAYNRKISDGIQSFINIVIKQKYVCRYTQQLLKNNFIPFIDYRKKETIDNLIKENSFRLSDLWCTDTYIDM